MSAIRVGVLRGGPSHEYDVSLKTGNSVLRGLSSDYKKHDILVDKTGLWHINGVPTVPQQLNNQVDVIINAMHGEYGEDGKVQNILDQVGIPYTGSGHMASSLGMNKVLAKEIFAQNNIKTPRGLIVAQDLDSETAAREIFNRLSPPWIIKPVSGGSSVGLYLAKTYYQLIDLITQA
ncbi:MAG: D-alanine--D-alanine ligase, partial [bacterium]